MILAFRETVYTAVELELFACLNRLEDLLTLPDEKLGTLELPLLQVLHILLQEVLVLGQWLSKCSPGLTPAAQRMIRSFGERVLNPSEIVPTKL